MAEWNDVKNRLELPFPQLPYFIDEKNEGAKITGPLPIIKYIAANYQPSLLGRSPEEQGSIENYAHIIIEFNKHA